MHAGVLTADVLDSRQRPLPPARPRTAARCRALFPLLAMGAGVVTRGGPTTVLLVDDHPLVRQGLQAVSAR